MIRVLSGVEKGSHRDTETQRDRNEHFQFCCFLVLVFLCDSVPLWPIQQRRRNVRKSTIYLFVLGLAVVVMAALVGGSVIVSAQNTNSSMTMTNTNTGAKNKPRRHKPKPKTTESGTAAGPTTEATPAPRKTGRCDPMQQEQTDLSGTYTGKVDYSDAGLTGDATLTITGANFTLTAGSATQSGRVTAVTTCGYTAATMMFGDLTPPTPSPNPPPALPAVSLRVRKMGDRVTLMSVPGEKRTFSFSSPGSMKTMPRRHKPKPKTTAPPPPPPQQ